MQIWCWAMLFKALTELRGQSTIDVVCVIEELWHPFLSQLMIKALGLLHPDFAHHLLPLKASQEAQQSGIIQLPEEKSFLLQTTLKKVSFGPPPQGCSDVCVVNGSCQKKFISLKTHRWPQSPHRWTELARVRLPSHPTEPKTNVVWPSSLEQFSCRFLVQLPQ